MQVALPARDLGWSRLASDKNKRPVPSCIKRPANSARAQPNGIFPPAQAGPFPRETVLQPEKSITPEQSLQITRSTTRYNE